MRILASLILAGMISISLPVSALTLKSGQVIGGDGKVYDGASPASQQLLIDQAAKGGKSAGVQGRNLYVVVDGTVTFIPLADLSGKTQQGIESLVVERVTDTIVGSVGATMGETEDIASEADDAASEAEIDASLNAIAAADVAGISAADAAALTKEAWGDISREDLAEATAYAAEFAAGEAASIATSEALAEGLLEDLNNGDISLEQAIAAAEQDPNYDGHCYENC